MFEYAVGYLARRAASSAELAVKLRAKAANPADVDHSIARLREIGYLNDERFAESFVARRVENEGFGKARLLSDLRARRVPSSLAEPAVEQALEGRNESDMADAWIRRRMPRLAAEGNAAEGKIEDQRKLASAWRRLRRAGFSSAAALGALKRLAAKPDELEEPAPDEVEDEVEEQ